MGANAASRAAEVAAAGGFGGPVAAEAAARGRR